MTEDILEILITKETIAERVKSLAKQLDNDYFGKNPLVVCVLKGAFIFASDLLREVSFPCDVDFFAASSYGAGTETTGELTIYKDISFEVKGRDVIIVEDILDTGVTLSKVSAMLKKRGAASVAICVLLDKPSRRKISINPEYSGFNVPNEFVVGYGLDFNEKYRQLPFIGVLKPEVYS